MILIYGILLNNNINNQETVNVNINVIVDEIGKFKLNIDKNFINKNLII